MPAHGVRAGVRGALVTTARPARDERVTERHSRAVHPVPASSRGVPRPIKPASRAIPHAALVLCTRTSTGGASSSAAPMPSGHCNKVTTINAVPSRNRPWRRTKAPRLSTQMLTTSASTGCNHATTRPGTRARADGRLTRPPGDPDHGASIESACQCPVQRDRRAGHTPRERQHRETAEHIAEQDRRTVRTGRGDTERGQTERESEQRKRRPARAPVPRTSRERHGDEHAHEHERERRDGAMQRTRQIEIVRRRRGIEGRRCRQLHAERPAHRPLLARRAWLREPQPRADARDDDHQRDRGPGELAERPQAAIRIHRRDGSARKHRIISAVPPHLPVPPATSHPRKPVRSASLTYLKARPA